jgi:DNA-binding IclR family transcriptional regulator
VIAAISASGTRVRLPDAFIPTVADAVKKAAKKLRGARIL